MERYLMQTAEITRQVYETNVKKLPVIERLRLVKLVMDDLMSDSATWIVDENDAWSQEDYVDFSRASLAYAAQSLGGHVE